jgi:hypothetical protein
MDADSLIQSLPLETSELILHFTIRAQITDYSKRFAEVHRQIRQTIPVYPIPCNSSCEEFCVDHGQHIERTLIRDKYCKDENGPIWVWTRFGYWRSQTRSVYAHPRGEGRGHATIDAFVSLVRKEREEEDRWDFYDEFLEENYQPIKKRRL